MNHPRRNRHSLESAPRPERDYPRLAHRLGESVVKSLIEDLGHHETNFMQGWVAVDGIRQFMEGQRDLLPAFPGLSADGLKYYHSDHAKPELQKWLAAFGQTINSTQNFNAMRESGQDFNLNDWRLMDESVNTALNALRAKIERIAEPSQSEM